MNSYVGNSLQTRGAETYVLQNGKGDGMHFLFVRNGKGLEVWISLDRAGDVSRVSFLGENMGYFAPCGYVAPQYYDRVGAGFLKSFTAGFFTTCGLTAVGSPCTDDGEELPLHGTLSHIPATVNNITETDDALTVCLTVEDAALFGRKLVMTRQYVFSYTENTFTVTDSVQNQADTASPYMILYHCNMGYPLLDEHSIVTVPHNGVTPRNAHAAEFADSALQMEKPQAGYEECCYYYDVAQKDGEARVGIFSPTVSKGVVMCYDKTALPYFTEWKMMGKRDYVLGLEPGNCTPDGRDVLRQNGTLAFLQPDEIATTGITFRFAEDKPTFEGAF